MSDRTLRALERRAHGGDFNAAVQLEIAVARIVGRCPCRGEFPDDLEYHDYAVCAYWEVFRDFDEHGGYRPTLNGLLAARPLAEVLSERSKPVPLAEVLSERKPVL